MPVKSKNSFNLIKKDVSIRTAVKSEVNWHARINILIITAVTSLGILSFFVSSFLEQELDIKKNEVISYANKNVNTDEKHKLKSRISLLNDRYALYQSVKNENVNITQVYEDLKGLYTNLEIKQVDLVYGGEDIAVEVAIPINAYENLSYFLNAIKNSEKLSDSQVKNISFSTVDGQSSANIKINLKYN